MTSIHDVAQKAQVSTATVARVLNSQGVVSPTLTARVRLAVEELNYTPNGIARSLSRGRTNLLGLVVADISNPFTAQLARGLEDEASAHGFHVLVGSSDFHPERESQLLRAFASRTVDAVALVSVSAGSAALTQLIDTKMPLVFVDRRPDVQTMASLIRIDNLSAAKEAVRYLIGLGHTDLAMLSGPDDMSTAAERLEGFRSACAVGGLTVREECIRRGHLGIDGGYNAMNDVLALTPRPTAVFSFNNLLAIGALRALAEAEVVLPDDLSFITFDDMDLFPFVKPPITAIAQPAYEIGIQAAKLLFGLLNGDSSLPHELTLPTELRLRGSCAVPVDLSL